MNNDRIRFFVTVVFAFALTSCVSTSLEDAAPTAVPSQPTNLTAISQETAAQEPNQQTAQEALQAPLPATTAQQPTANNTVPTATSSQSASSNNAVAVDSNAIPPKPTGEQFPSFAEEKRGETNQMTPEEKAAIEAQMTELLIQRETDPRIKARYQARLRYLRQLAKTHASDTSAKIAQ